MTADGPLMHKYDVARTDGRDAPGEKHDGCFLFVLDLTHDPYARPALITYAAACAGTHPTLAASLRAALWWDGEPGEGMDRAAQRLEAILQAVGAASMCWETVEGAGTFRSDMAAKVARDLDDQLRRIDGEVP